MGSKFLFWIGLLLTLVWAGAVAYLCRESWPSLPLDLGGDPGTLAAYEQAQWMHVGYYTLLGIAPPALALLLSRLLTRR